MSVVIPCYRYGQYLPDAVAGALRQPGLDVEVIVVDDASPDGSGEVARSLAAADPRVTAAVHESNQGHIATYNDGIARATGEFLVLLSADDLLAPAALSRAAAVLGRHADVGLVYGFAPDFTHTPVPTRRLLPHYARWPGAAWIDRVCARGQNPVCTPTAVMRRDLVTRVGGYDAALPHTADLLMWLRAADAADVAYVSGVDQAYYRVHGANMHSTAYAELDADLRHRREAFRAFLAGSHAPAATTRTRADRVARALDAEAARARRRSSAGSAWTRRADGLTDVLDWRYWRRFGLRL